MVCGMSVGHGWRLASPDALDAGSLEKLQLSLSPSQQDLNGCKVPPVDGHVLVKLHPRKGLELRPGGLGIASVAVPTPRHMLLVAKHTYFRFLAALAKTLAIQG